MPKVFISYSHDSKMHGDRVLDLADRLRGHGVDAEIDQYEESPPGGWPAWCDRQIREANFVLLVCTETYMRRVDGEEEQGKGGGVMWEAHLICQHLYDERCRTRKFVPVLFSDCSSDFIPRPLRGVTHYFVDDPDGYECLLRLLTDQPRVVRSEVAPLKPLSPRIRMWSSVGETKHGVTPVLPVTLTVQPQSHTREDMAPPIRSPIHWLIIAVLCVFLSLLFRENVTRFLIALLIIIMIFCLPWFFKIRAAARAADAAARAADQGGIFFLIDLVSGLFRYGAIFWITGTVLIHVSPNILGNSLESAYSSFIEQEKSENKHVPPRLVVRKGSTSSEIYVAYYQSSAQSNELEVGRFASSIKFSWENLKIGNYLEATGTIGFIMGFILLIVEQLAIFMYQLRR